MQACSLDNGHHPCLLSGLYNKLVKLEGHDQEDKGKDEKGKSTQQRRESTFS